MGHCNSLLIVCLFPSMWGRGCFGLVYRQIYHRSDTVPVVLVFWFGIILQTHLAFHKLPHLCIIIYQLTESKKQSGKKNRSDLCHLQYYDVAFS